MKKIEIYYKQKAKKQTIKPRTHQIETIES